MRQSPNGYSARRLQARAPQLRAPAPTPREWPSGGPLTCDRARVLSCPAAASEVEPCLPPDLVAHAPTQDTPTIDADAPADASNLQTDMALVLRPTPGLERLGFCRVYRDRPAPGWALVGERPRSILAPWSAARVRLQPGTIRAAASAGEDGRERARRGWSAATRGRGHVGPHGVVQPPWCALPWPGIVAA